MADPSPSEIAVRDPLSEVTRNERRFLLGVSMVAIIIVKTGLVPSKISALGIEFTKTDQKSLLYIIALVTGYFIAAFAIYAVSDFIAWRFAFRVALRERIIRRRESEEERLRDPEAAEMLARLLSGRLLFTLSRPVSVIRALFEFVLPIAVGVYAIIALLRVPAS